MPASAFLLALAAILPVFSQDSGVDVATQVSAAQDEQGLPGDLPGTERWIVHFEKRSFDLSGFREAVFAGRSAKDVGEIVKALQQDVIADQKGFAQAVTKIGGKVQVQWWIINACAVDIPHEALARLRAIQNVASVEPDREHLPVIKTATNSKNHNADALQAKNIIGTGVTAAIMDTGQDSNMGTSGRPHRTYYPLGDSSKKTGTGIGKSRLILNKKLGAMSADDTHGHGTGVASIVAGGKWGTSTADHGHAYGANIAGYAIASTSKGGAFSTVIVTAWQAIAADKVKYKIVSANNSYSGSPNPLSAVQRALDSAALNADVMVCTAAGNNGTRVTSSQICVNGLSVGAVSENSHKRASFSSRGIPDGQLFPDICANGVSTNMARRNNETRDYVGSGTSMASPQVCGAATQIRAANLKLRADETKAILLASTEKSPLSGSTQVSTGPGCGYLRNDAAYTIAMSPKRHGRLNMSKTQPAIRFNLVVKKGLDYQVAVTWHRQNVNSSTWSNIDLSVSDGPNTVIASNTTRNTEEFVRFTASKSGVFVVQILATSLAVTSQPVAWAATADFLPNNTMPGSYAVFGKGCPGTFNGNFKLTPDLGNSGVPELQKSFKVDLSLARTNSVGVLIFGLSKTSFGGTKLPLSLGFLGAKGCSLLTSYDFTMVTTTDSVGGAVIQIPIPNVSALGGKTFHNQFYVLDKAANGLGLSFTNGGTAKIGG